MRGNIWIQKENDEKWRRIGNKSGLVNDLLKLLPSRVLESYYVEKSQFNALHEYLKEDNQPFIKVAEILNNAPVSTKNRHFLNINTGKVDDPKGLLDTPAQSLD